MLELFGHYQSWRGVLEVDPVLICVRFGTQGQDRRVGEGHIKSEQDHKKGVLELLVLIYEEQFGSSGGASRGKWGVEGVIIEHPM
jgi:hypothetical protein